MVNNAEAAERSIKTYDDIYESSALLADPHQPCLMETREFLKLFARTHKHRVSRRTLQLYSSPKLKLLPLPIHRGGHKSYYLNPEHRLRLAVILRLQKKLYFPLKVIQRVLKDFPPEHYRFILEGVLSGEEILEFAILKGRGYDIRDIIYRRVCTVLESIDEPYWTAQMKYGKAEEDAIEGYVTRVLSKELDGIKKWLKAGRYRQLGIEEWKHSEEDREIVDSLPRQKSAEDGA